MRVAVQAAHTATLNTGCRYLNGYGTEDPPAYVPPGDDTWFGQYKGLYVNWYVSDQVGATALRRQLAAHWLDTGSGGGGRGAEGQMPELQGIAPPPSDALS